MSERCPHCGGHLPARAIDPLPERLRADLEAAGQEVLPGGLVRERAAALVLGLEPGTLRNWRARNRGPAYRKSGGRVLYELTELANFREGGR